MESANTLTELLPSVRVTPEMRAALESIAAKSMAKSISDHIRYAVEMYIEREKQLEQQQKPV